MDLDDFMQARVIEAVRESVARLQGPWLDRKHAGFYCQCSPSEVDRAADAGAFKRYYRAGTPLFKKSEIDAAIEQGKWPGRSVKREGGGSRMEDRKETVAA